MTNVIDFNAFLQTKNATKEQIATGEDILTSGAKLVTEYYKKMTVAAEELTADIGIPLATMVRVVNAAIASEKFQSLVGNRFGLLTVDSGAALSMKNAIQLVNMFSTEQVPIYSMTVIGMYTKETIRFLKGIDVTAVFDEVRSGDPELVGDVRTVQRVVMDYIYVHPDVDTKRDSGSGHLSSLCYEIIGELINHGYAMSDYAYTVDYIGGSSKIHQHPRHILVNFVKGDEHIYLYYDHEAAMKMIELYLKQVFNID